MTTGVDSAKIVPPVDVAMGAGAGRGAVNPAALTVEQLARAIGLPVETVHRHVAEGAPAGADGTINLIHYAAWLNKRLVTAEPEAKPDGD